MNRPDLPEDPEIQLVETENGEVTLSIEGGQAMQAWERELMNESADILCGFGSRFLEVGLGLGISALRIASRPGTRHHLVLEKYQKVIDLFQQRHPVLPSSLEILEADIFESVDKLEPGSYDGIFFDPALPEQLWDDLTLWDEFMPRLIRALRPQGAFVPFFSTVPELRKQYIGHFNRVIVEKRPFRAYDTTEYTSGTSGQAYIQCYIRTA